MKKEKVENPNAFKLWINRDLLEKIGTAILKIDPEFDHRQFVSIAKKLGDLELKPRVHCVRDQLHKQLPSDFPKALDILMKSLEIGEPKVVELKGFALWPYTEFIQKFGLNDPKISLDALKEITKLFTSEFAIRPFIKAYPKESLRYLLRCSKDKDVHVRRWSSEGSRSRLPWGERLDIFIKDPNLTVPILENLKYDEELYVRKSVSNHLNDLAKDNPAVVLKLLRKWKTETPEKHRKKIDWIIHRSLRTLIKNGHPKALDLIGAKTDIKVQVGKLKINKSGFKLNDRIEFEIEIKSKSKQELSLVVDYIIHYVKSNSRTSPKVFKLKNLSLKAGEKITLKKSHHLKQVTTRSHYSGEHALEIQINGKRYAGTKWRLKA